MFFFGMKKTDCEKYTLKSFQNAVLLLLRSFEEKEVVKKLHVYAHDTFCDDCLC